ncbi:Inositol-pentakisphosphate 2-kinase [Carpediemonas membranifera]|uniref:Inositol-pentakisphosphate 2-kinase n=1 Tax=Carpediemonas membranifera TaxID=201153 RepID=A0A8J6E465_9EUKA|nr:Inositol-pentakisphosphate 2-kinase [Carpediemonas membranifera]|eukprot:KAG9394072.1 Inositol-pentakisphosphate 2-kinase [Carpediemonas membranifera]
MTTIGEWCFVDEGGSSLVFQYIGSSDEYKNHVLRITKNVKELALDDRIRLESIVEPIIRPHILKWKLIPLPSDFLTPLLASCNAVRSPQRISSQKSVCPTAMLMESAFSDTNTNRTPLFAFELKPKRGFCDVGPDGKKLAVSHYRRLQQLKLATGQIREISGYDPIDIFSGDLSRVTAAVQFLLANPQNNLKIFSFNGSSSSIHPDLIFGGRCKEPCLPEFVNAVKIAKILAESDALKAIHNLQNLSQDFISDIKSVFETLNQPFDWAGQPLSASTPLARVQRYLIAASANDCSLIVTVFTDGLTRERVVDLDIKEPWRLERWEGKALQRLDACITDVDTEISRLNGMVLSDEKIDARLGWMDASRALLASMRSSTPKSDIPTLMREALTQEFGEDIPDEEGDASKATAEEVTSALLALDLHHRCAISFVRQAAASLSHSLLLSMNRPLAPGEDLPPRLFTLNQGVVWACLMGGGANPDLEDSVPVEGRKLWPSGHMIHDKIRNALTPEGKCLWFLCRKFFFTMNVAEKDGESYHYSGRECYYHHRMYMGRLFMLDPEHHTAFTRARMPRARGLQRQLHPHRHDAQGPVGLGE